MANFKTHLTVAAGVSGLLATTCFGAGIAEPDEVVILSIAGTLGGILPDIDLDTSSPVKIVFTGLALIVAFAVMFSRAAHHYSILELWIVWGISYALIRYVATEAFKKFTIHRGIFHSLAAALFFWFLATTLSYRLLMLGELTAWMTGFFIFLGFLVHLTLDELYSVDFVNRRIKRSFGTALKVVDYRNHLTSALMSGAALLMFLTTPSAATFVKVLTHSDTYYSIAHRFLPAAGWFQL